MTLLSSEIEKYFNLIKVDSNPVSFSIREVFKSNGKVQSSIREEVYNLEKYQLDITDISSIRTMLFTNMTLSNVKEIKLSKNALIMFFRDNKKVILKELKDISSKNFIITSTETFNSFLSELECEVIIDNSVKDIIVGERTDFLIREISSTEIEFYFDKSKFYSLRIK
jgi:hypothetical protein